MNAGNTNPANLFTAGNKLAPKPPGNAENNPANSKNQSQVSDKNPQRSNNADKSNHIRSLRRPPNNRSLSDLLKK